MQTTTIMQFAQASHTAYQARQQAIQSQVNQYQNYVLTLYPDDPIITAQVGNRIGNAIVDSNGYLARRTQLANEAAQVLLPGEAVPNLVEPLANNVLADPENGVNNVVTTIVENSYNPTLSFLGGDVIIPSGVLHGSPSRMLLFLHDERVNSHEIENMLARVRTDMINNLDNPDFRESVRRLNISILEHRENFHQEIVNALNNDRVTEVFRFPNLSLDYNVLNNFFELFTSEVLEQLVRGLSTQLHSNSSRVMILALLLAFSGSLLRMTYFQVFNISSSQLLYNVRHIIEQILSRRGLENVEAELTNITNTSLQSAQAIAQNLREQAEQLSSSIIQRVYNFFFGLFRSNDNHFSFPSEGNLPNNVSISTEIDDNPMPQNPNNNL